MRTFEVLREFRPALGGTPYVARQAERAPGPEHKPRRTRTRIDCSPLCQLDGPDREVPFDLVGVPAIKPDVQAALDRNCMTTAKAKSIGATVRRATAELRRRYERHNEQTLAALVAREAEEDAGEI